MVRKRIGYAAAALLGLAAAQGHAASADSCEPVPPAPCYSTDDCRPTFCLGPNVVNPAVNPKTCDGDVVLTASGFYWFADEDGLEFGVANEVSIADTDPFTTTPLNNLTNAKYLGPDFSWEPGFKVGIAYNSNHDGWDFGVLWTWWRGRAIDTVEFRESEAGNIITLWSAYAGSIGEIANANKIDYQWRLKLDLVDVELGREMWVSKYLTFRPFIGIRFGWLNQDYDLQTSDGVYRVDDVVDEIEMKNYFRGIGLRSGFNTVWNFGRGWGLYGDFALSLIYGRFRLKNEEVARGTSPPFNKRDILETKENFDASRGMFDCILGIKWESLFSECRYLFTLQLGWEQHMFFNQNQLWRVVRTGDVEGNVLNDTGENTFYQRRGDLQTEGVILTLKLGF